MEQPVAAVICEYNPFHKGHLHQLHEIRNTLPGAIIIGLMSTCFTQRGDPALFSPCDRARMALRSGMDMVFALPTSVSLSNAQRFAAGGVDLACALGFVTHLSFGAESSLRELQQVASLLENPTEEFQQTLRNALKRGESFPSAQGEAILTCFRGRLQPNAWTMPNNMLAIEYLRAIIRSGGTIKPLPILREGSYHKKKLKRGEAPSAEAIREAFIAGDFALAQSACPETLPMKPLCLPNALDRVMLYALRSKQPEEIASAPDCSEGLENRLYQACRIATTKEELLSGLKTKRYPYARLNRLCTRLMLDIPAFFPEDGCTWNGAHLLGFRNTAQVRQLLGESKIPIMTRAQELKQNENMVHYEEKAYDLWALGAGIPSGMLWRQKTIVIE